MDAPKVTNNEQRVTICPPDPRFETVKGFSALPTRQNAKYTGGNFVGNPRPDIIIKTCSFCYFLKMLSQPKGTVKTVNFKTFLKMIDSLNREKMR